MHGYEQCYNAQAAVDAEHQVIVATGLTNRASDQGQLGPMLERIEDNAGEDPAELSADADNCSEENLECLEERCIRGYVATGRRKHDEPSAVNERPASPGTLRARMQARLRRGGWRSCYRLRKQTVEPVFGQMKWARGFRQFLLRGIEKVSAEWDLVCTAHNLLKLAKAMGGPEREMSLSPAL